MAEINITEQEEKKSLNFIEQRVKTDLAEGKNGSRLQTRFPPEPNGYLHIGHAKAIAMDFGVAQKFGGVCNLRMDDTNPQKEDTEYVEAIERDIKWLGFQWGKVCYASDYFQDLWDFAEWCILQGHAYVDEQSSEEIAAQKGTPTEPGTNSPFRERPAEESLKLFREMNSGNVEPGKMILRAKIDMANPNMHFRDPIMYRVLNMEHWRTGNKWNAYPMYDFTHGQSDYLEGVTHSICTLEFVEHRPLYDLFVNWNAIVNGGQAFSDREAEIINNTKTSLEDNSVTKSLDFSSGNPDNIQPADFNFIGSYLGASVWGPVTKYIGTSPKLPSGAYYLAYDPNHNPTTFFYKAKENSSVTGSDGSCLLQRKEIFRSSSIQEMPSTNSIK